MEFDKEGNGLRKSRNVARSKEQREMDLVLCSDMFIKGYSYREIKARLDVDLQRRGLTYSISVTTIYKDLQQCLVDWKKERFDNIDKYVDKELKTLDKLEAEAWQAWERSTLTKEKKKERKNSDRPKNGQAEERNADYYGYNEVTTESLSGDPRFLDMILKCQQRRAKLLGYDAPLKVDFGKSPIDDESENYDINDIPNELLFAVVDKIQDNKLKELLIIKKDE